MNFLDGEVVADGVPPRFRLPDGAPVDLVPYRFARPARSGPAVLGVRPEHIALGDPTSADRHALRGTVRLVEPMGADMILWTAIGETPVTIRVDGESTLRRGDTIAFHFDVARASLFAADGGERL